MSTGANCTFIEESPGRWYYQIQQWPYGAWNEYDTEGPFASLDAAIDDMHDNYANPGGYFIEHYEKVT
jgi:hypothetical protein